MTTIRLIIPGRPVILKNSKRIIQVRGRPLIMSNPRVEAYQKRAGLILRQQWGGRPAITCPVGLRVTAYIAASSESGNLPDISNLYQCPEDVLQSAGILANDRQVEHHDGSRRICLCDGPCPRKPVYQSGPKRGQQKENCGAVKSCPFERLEIEISEASRDCLSDIAEYRAS